MKKANKLMQQIHGKRNLVKMKRSSTVEDIVEEEPLQKNKRLEIQHPTSHILLSVTEIQDRFAELVGICPIHELTLEKAARLYMSIPGVTAKLESAKSTASELMNKPDIEKRIIAYRNVYHTNKERLLVDRDLIFDEILESWRDRECYPSDSENATPAPVVRTNDLVGFMRDRDNAHGLFNNKQQSTVVIKLQTNNPNELMKEADDIIEAELLQPKQIEAGK
jgi:hypothetical protein